MSASEAVQIVSRLYEVCGMLTACVLSPCERYIYFGYGGRFFACQIVLERFCVVECTGDSLLLCGNEHSGEIEKRMNSEG